VPQVVARLVARSGSAGARPLAPRARAGELRGTQGLADLEKCFSELAPLAPGGGPR
jgi:hypothetical protein